VTRRTREVGALRLRFSVLEAIRAHRLWRPGETVAVAVSGGLDSVALLDLLRVTARAHGGRLSVVTVDHGTRPESAGSRWMSVFSAEALERGFSTSSMIPSVTSGRVAMWLSCFTAAFATCMQSLALAAGVICSGIST
jgi:hypothetical protein